MLDSPVEPYAQPMESPYLHVLIAGAIGGCVGDSSMHSLDTVKTRQQGAPYIEKYKKTLQAFGTIGKQEGFFRGLYSGYSAAMFGSLPATGIFFVTYEYIKRSLISLKSPEFLSHLTAGFIGDFASSLIYVPSEVMKTRMQIQGKYNNPHFHSGYNYKGLIDAMKTIYAKEGFGAFFFGYKATLVRDMPFSAIQLAAYEEFHKTAANFVGSNNLGVFLELITGAAAGGLAGVITTPLDVVKTRTQTELRIPDAPSPSPSNTNLDKKSNNFTSNNVDKSLNNDNSKINFNKSSSTTFVQHSYSTLNSSNDEKFRHLSTHAPSSSQPPGLNKSFSPLNSDSIIKCLYKIFREEGIKGLFSGVQPRFIWTSIQSSIMLLLYQTVLRQMNNEFLDTKTGKSLLMP